LMRPVHGRRHRRGGRIPSELRHVAEHLLLITQNGH